MALTKAKLIELIDNGDIDVGGGGGQNILHNWDFRNPVNQRAVTGAITTGTYFYDRWIRNSGTVTTNAAYLTVGAAAVIEQRIEGNLLAGETVTVSVMVGGTVYSGTGIMPTSGTASVTLTGWGTATLGYATGYMYVRLAPTAASNVVRVKLEFGTVSTLAYDPPMDHGVELPKCRRYFRNDLQSLYVPIHATTTECSFQVNLNPPMRVIPTITISNLASLIYMRGVDAYTPNSENVSDASVSRYLHIFGGSFGGGTLPTIQVSMTYINSISASADF